MQVDIKVKEFEKGIFKKKKFYEAVLYVQLTEEEKAIIKDNSLEDTIIARYDPPASTELNHLFELTFDILLRGDFYNDRATPLDVEEYKRELIADLKMAKEYLENNAKSTGDTSIEI